MACVLCLFQGAEQMLGLYEMEKDATMMEINPWWRYWTPQMIIFHGKSHPWG